MNESGYTWNSAPASAANIYGTRLYFTSSVVYPEDNRNRANGFPVRCVAE